MTECNCDACREERELEAKGELPEGLPTREMRKMVDEAIAHMAAAKIGLEPMGFQYAVLICRNKKTGQELPVAGVYKHTETDGVRHVAWMPLFAFVNIKGEVENWYVKGEEFDDSRIVTGEEYLLITQPIKGEPS